MPMFRSILTAALALAFAWPSTGWAADDDAVSADDEPTTDDAEPAKAAPVVPPTPDEDDDEPEPPLVPPALDTIGGHFNLAASAAWTVPFANVESGVAQGDAMGSGPGAGLDAAYGISRNVALGVWGQMSFLGEGDKCKGCSTRSTSFGGFIRYHLVQGMRFDPWMSAGLGYRLTSIDAAAGKVDYSGIEWLRLAVGGDWYAFDKVAFGPFMELGFGRYSSKSPGSLDESANHWHFGTGLRVVLDIPGK